MKKRNSQDAKAKAKKKKAFIDANHALLEER